MRDLFGSYMSRLGNPDDAGLQAMVLAACEQVIGAEMVRAQHFQGKASFNEVIRAENSANRKLKQLGLDKPPARKQQSISEALAAAGFRPPVASPAPAVPEQRRDETRTTEPANATEASA